MNADEAKKKFIEENIRLLTADEFDRTRYRNLLRTFFVEKHGKRFGQPTVTDIAAALVSYFKRSGLENEKIHQYVESLAFFKQLDSGQQRKLLADLPKTNESALAPEDLVLLRSGRSFEALERHKGQEVAVKQEQKLQALTEQFEAKKYEYESLPSVLDEGEIEEPAFNVEVEERKSWWERFYLESNPFPRKDGLQAIPPELYEEIVVKTEPFSQLQSDLSKDPNCLFNTGRLLAGNFGYGKTTFLDYLEHYLVQLDIVTIRMSSAKPYPSAEGYIDAFLLSLFKKTLEQVERIRDAQNDTEAAIEDKVAFNCDLICDRKKGILIVLDDYHKHPRTEAVFDFLGLLQIVKDQLGRQELNVGFIVSGLPDWIQKIQKHPQLSGFLDSPPIVMPDITVASVVSVFNKRISAFCFDSEARTIRNEFVERIFGKLGAGSYRDYLNAIVSELESNNLAIVNSPVEISEDQLSDIRKTIESDPANNSAMKKLLFGSRFQNYNEQQIRKCLEIIVQISLRNGVSEKDIFFVENAFYFQRLKEVSLLQKRKGGPQNAKFCWTIHNLLQSKFSDINAKSRLSPSDYLLKIYGGKDHAIATHSDSEVTQPIFSTDQLGKLPDPVASKVRQALSIFQSSGHSRALSAEDSKLAAKRIERAVTNVLECMFELDGSEKRFKSASIDDLRLRASLHWKASNEDVIEALRRFQMLPERPDRQEAQMAIRQGTNAFEYGIDGLQELCRDLTDSNRPFGFRHKAAQHDAQFLKILDDAQEGYFSAKPSEHFEYVSNLVDWVETYLRRFLYATCVLSFGLEKYFDNIPKNQQKDAYKNAKNRELYSTVFNHFDGFTRSQYRAVFNEKSLTKDIIMDRIPIIWDADDKAMFFNLFAEESIATSHNQERAFSPLVRERYEKLCSMCERIVATMNEFLGSIVCDLPVIQVDNRSALENIENCVFKFGMSAKRGEQMPTDNVVELGNDLPILNHDKLFDHTTTAQLLEKVVGSIEISLEQDNVLIENLLDLDYLQSHYGVCFPEFLCCITYASRVQQRFTVSRWSGSSILLRR